MDFIEILKDFGFPVVVTFYLLHRIENKLDLLVTSSEKVCTVITEKWA